MPVPYADGRVLCAHAHCLESDILITQEDLLQAHADYEQDRQQLTHCLTMPQDALYTGYQYRYSGFHVLDSLLMVTDYKWRCPTKQFGTCIHLRLSLMSLHQQPFCLV